MEHWRQLPVLDWNWPRGHVKVGCHPGTLSRNCPSSEESMEEESSESDEDESWAWSSWSRLKLGSASDWLANAKPNKNSWMRICIVCEVWGEFVKYERSNEANQKCARLSSKNKQTHSRFPHLDGHTGGWGVSRMRQKWFNCWMGMNELLWLWSMPSDGSDKLDDRKWGKGQGKGGLYEGHQPTVHPIRTSRTRPFDVWWNCQSQNWVREWKMKSKK